jgi:hypothetical protein
VCPHVSYIVCKTSQNGLPWEPALWLQYWAAWLLPCSCEKLSCRIAHRLFPSTHALNNLERSLKRMHVHGSHPLFLQVVLILPLVWTHPENVTCQISLGEQNNCQHHAGFVAWAVVPAGQLHNVDIELLYALYKWMYANPLGLLEHIGKVVLLLLSCIVRKHSEEVKHNAAVE